MQCCRTCGIQKDDKEFRWRSDHNKLTTQCKSCENAHKKRFYMRFQEDIKRRTKARYHRKKFELTKVKPIRVNTSSGMLYVIGHSLAVVGEPHLYFVKVGITKDQSIDRRFNQIQSSSAFNLEVIVTKNFNEVGDIESFFHDCLNRAHYSMRGEWFSFGISELENLRKAILNLNTDPAFLASKPWIML